MKRSDPLGRAHDMRAIQKRTQGLTRHEGRYDISQRGMLGERIKCRHKGVALLPALSLEHLMVSPSIVCPNIAAGRAMWLFLLASALNQLTGRKRAGMETVEQS